MLRVGDAALAVRRAHGLCPGAGRRHRSRFPRRDAGRAVGITDVAAAERAPAAVSVIDRETIRASGFRDIPDLLRLVPGFSVAYTRDNTWGVGYHGLGDAYSRRFQVLVDGRSIYGPHFGAVHWGDLPLAIEDIERIEVVRGPNAAVYGSNAFLAVINIITQRAAQAKGGQASVQYGAPAVARQEAEVVARRGIRQVVVDDILEPITALRRQCHAPAAVGVAATVARDQPGHPLLRIPLGKRLRPEGLREPFGELVTSPPRG